MVESTYENFLIELNKLAFYNSEAEEQRYSLKDVVNEDDIKQFYVKGFYFKDQPLENTEILLLTESSIRIIRLVEDGYIEVVDRSYDSLSKVSLIHRNRKSTSLKLSFADNVLFVLDSVRDSEHRKSEFQTRIMEIYKFLLLKLEK
ncbi:hypothetical protein NCCP2716_27650 [Sporosarcina sp. NCCP-2716]|uniref:hypothetical protein n=1 Tax=Sporosarcina sp. NCCP-2716 TaxID=2943679 RepID=UPI00203E017B|nr:hypothetical protein [Sporosarcina sp. NCCP-2716]GKV70267.1 hypothetical protein NCCP2716_27650 [Sporosarcina sp. NCCP-2716]